MEVTLTDIVEASIQRNLVYNYNFLYYSNRDDIGGNLDYNHPDGWMHEDDGPDASIGYDPSEYACLIQKSNGNELMRFNQYISEFPRWENTLIGQTVSATAIIKNPDSATGSYDVKFYLKDGVISSQKTITLGPGMELPIDIELDVHSSAKYLELGIECDTKLAILLVKEVFANIGRTAISTLPCMVNGVIGERRQYVSTQTPPAEELSLCGDNIELTASQTRLNSFLNGRFGTGANGYSYLPPMGGYFSRAWNPGTAVDPDRNGRLPLGASTIDGNKVGTMQEDVFEEHVHGLKFDKGDVYKPYTAPVAPMNVINTAVVSDTDPAGKGNQETRSKNIYELYTMKWA